jgi:hypothetical protein
VRADSNSKEKKYKQVKDTGAAQTHENVSAGNESSGIGASADDERTMQLFPDQSV